jgi:hypothetical protein
VTIQIKAIIAELVVDYRNSIIAASATVHNFKSSWQFEYGFAHFFAFKLSEYFVAFTTSVTVCQLQLTGPRKTTVKNDGCSFFPAIHVRSILFGRCCALKNTEN